MISEMFKEVDRAVINRCKIVTRKHNNPEDAYIELCLRLNELMDRSKDHWITINRIATRSTNIEIDEIKSCLCRYNDTGKFYENE